MDDFGGMGGWYWGWEATGSDLPGDPPKRSRPVDVDAEVRAILARIAVRDQMAALLRYRQTIDDERWLNDIGITGEGG